jgi:hypothetical protein
MPVAIKRSGCVAKTHGDHMMGVKPHYLLSLVLQEHLTRNTWCVMAFQAQVSPKARTEVMDLWSHLCTGYFAHPFEDLQLRLPCLPLLLPHELDGGRKSEVLLSLQRNNLNPTRKTDVSSQNTL